MERLRRTCFTLVSLTVPYRPLPRLPLSVCPCFQPSLRRMSTIRSPTPTQGVADAFKIPSHFRELPEVPGTDPKRRVMDAFRIAIAQFLVEALPGLTIEKAIEGVDYGRKEDFMVALPRFRLPEKPAELAQKVISKVCSLAACVVSFWMRRQHGILSCPAVDTHLHTPACPPNLRRVSAA